MTRVFLAGALLLASVMAVTGYAQAQTSEAVANVKTYDAQTDFYGRGKNVAVMERARPDYEALGLHDGGFTIFPSIEVSATYTDNVYAVKNSPPAGVVGFNKVGDTYATITPSIVAQSNWGRHGLRLFGSVTNVDYANYSGENQTGYVLRADGKIDVHGQSVINLGVDAQRAYEPRGNVYATTDTVHPIHYDTQGVYARGSYVQDRLKFTLDGEFRNYDYANAALFGGGVVDESTRNEHIGDVLGRVDYALSPDSAVFGQYTYTRSQYLEGASITRRDSDTNAVLGGVNFDLTSVARGEIGLGYSKREYDSASYQGLAGFTAAVKLEYFPSQLLTLTFLAQRRPQDAAFISSGGFFQNSVSVQADYELRRNWLVSASAGYEHDQFDGIARRDNVSNAVVSTRYFLNRTVGVGADLSYADRSSTGGAFVGPSYKDTKLGVFVVFQR